MKRSDFNYDLPDELIARFPTQERTGSRLMVLHGEGGAVEHRQFVDLLDYLRPGDLLVFNDTRVMPARLFARKATGGQVEILIERLLDAHNVLAHVRSSRSPKPGSELELLDHEQQLSGRKVTVTGREANLFCLRFDEPAFESLELLGHMPLPPYIDREDQLSDRERYQTVYANKAGAVAAPTAGLHFSEDYLAKCRDMGVDTAFVTLHVGAGTFQPVKTDDIREHAMHSEYLEVSPEVCEQVKRTRESGGRVVAVGTTAVRSLETAAGSGELQPYAGDSDIFIYPGYRFRAVDMILTNFHLPESTLIMLISAFAGRDKVLSAYREAVAQQYRFFSYGDAMLVFPEQGSHA